VRWIVAAWLELPVSSVIRAFFRSIAFAGRDSRFPTTVQEYDRSADILVRFDRGGKLQADRNVRAPITSVARAYAHATGQSCAILAEDVVAVSLKPPMSPALRSGSGLQRASLNGPVAQGFLLKQCQLIRRCVGLSIAFVNILKYLVLGRSHPPGGGTLARRVSASNIIKRKRQAEVARNRVPGLPERHGRFSVAHLGPRPVTKSGIRTPI
jgi:hypothetical protein